MIGKFFDSFDGFWTDVKSWACGSSSRGCLIEAVQVALIVSAVLLVSFGCSLSFVVVAGGYALSKIVPCCFSPYRLRDL